MAVTIEQLEYILKNPESNRPLDAETARAEAFKLLSFFDPNNYHALENHLAPEERSWLVDLEKMFGFVKGYMEDDIILRRPWKICWWVLDEGKVSKLYDKLKNNAQLPRPESNSLYLDLPDEVWQRNSKG